jgi:hypothetical protein
VDNTIGRLYDKPSLASLQAAIATWESQGFPHDSMLARHRAETFSLPVFRNRILDLLARVTARELRLPIPPPPHIELPRPATAEWRGSELL